MNSSICPFCHRTVPSLQLESHANSHFEDEELARDMELAQQIALAPSSPGLTSKNQLNNDLQCETNTHKPPETSTSRNASKTSDGGDGDINEKISCLISLQLRATFYKVEDGLMTLLRNCLELESDNSTSILSGYIDHFHSIEEDVGWGCGWRNIQMLSSHLLMQRKEAREVLFGSSGFVPDIASLQRWLEIAWEKGFDILGSNDFDHRIYGKTNWIGTTECATLFRSFGLRARIVDFGTKEIETSSSDSCGMNVNRGKRKSVQVSGPMDKFLTRVDNRIPHLGNHPGTSVFKSDDNPLDNGDVNLSFTTTAKGHQVLIDWVWNYFSEIRLTKSCNPRVTVTDRAPLYFQHDGHSRTIVGIQAKRQRNGMLQHSLLILDPAHKTAALEKSLKENVGWQKLIKRGVHTLKKPQYQLCNIERGIAHGEEMDQLKTLDSVYFEF